MSGRGCYFNRWYLFLMLMLLIPFSILLLYVRYLSCGIDDPRLMIQSATLSLLTSRPQMTSHRWNINITTWNPNRCNSIVYKYTKVFVSLHTDSTNISSETAYFEPFIQEPKRQVAVMATPETTVSFDHLVGDVKFNITFRTAYTILHHPYIQKDYKGIPYFAVGGTDFIFHDVKIQLAPNATQGKMVGDAVACDFIQGVRYIIYNS